MDEPLFRNAHAALQFAFHFEGSPERPVMNRMSDGPTRTGNGMAGLDGAAQAGLIKAEVDALGDPGRWIITARYSPMLVSCGCGAPCCTGNRPGKEWQRAIDKLQQWVLVQGLAGCVSYYHLRRGLVENCFGARHALGALADKCNVNRDTASEHNARVRLKLSGFTPKSGHGQAVVGEIERSMLDIGERLHTCGITL